MSTGRRLPTPSKSRQRHGRLPARRPEDAQHHRDGRGIIGALYGAYLAYLGDTALGVVLIVMGAFLFLASATRYMDRCGAVHRQARHGTPATFTVVTSASTPHRRGQCPRLLVAGRQRHREPADDRAPSRPVTVCWIPTRAMGSAAERDAQLAFIRAHVGEAPGTPVYGATRPSSVLTGAELHAVPAARAVGRRRGGACG